MRSEDNRPGVRGLEVRFRTLRDHLNSLGDQVNSVAAMVERIERLHGLYTSRHTDPKALPGFMVECQLVEKDLGSVLTELNRYIFARRAGRTDERTVETTARRPSGGRPSESRSRLSSEPVRNPGDDEPDWVANFDPDDFETPRR